MLSDYLIVGDRLEMTAQENDSSELNDGIPVRGKKKTYRSRIYDILGDDEIEIEMPMEGGQLQLLPVGRSYDLCFYTANGLMQCFATVAERYKVQSVFVLRMVFTSNLRKYQRREYYRFHCVLEMQCGQVEDDILQERESVELLGTDITLENGVIVDISGGGARFISKKQYEPDSLVSFRFSLMTDREPAKFSLLGRVIGSKPVSDRENRYENRIQFVNINNYEREIIIKYIFEEERKIRRKGN